MAKISETRPYLVLKKKRGGLTIAGPRKEVCWKKENGRKEVVIN